LLPPAHFAVNRIPQHIRGEVNRHQRAAAGKPSLSKTSLNLRIARGLAAVAGAESAPTAAARTG